MEDQVKPSDTFSLRPAGKDEMVQVFDQQKAELIAKTTDAH